MNHNRRKFTPTADMPRPMARTQTRHEFGRGHTVRYVITDMPRLDGTRGDVTVREFKKLRAMAKSARRDVRRAATNAAGEVRRNAVTSTSLLADDSQFRCTICGQIGTVGRCCGLDTREPMNDLARAELADEKMRKANKEVAG